MASSSIWRAWRRRGGDGYHAAVTGVPPGGASNRERVSWEFEWLNRHDVAPLVQHMWTADTEVRFPDRTTRGPEQLAEYLNGAFAGLKGWHMDVLAMAGEGEDVFVRWRLTGRHVGELFGITPTGKSVALDGIDHFVLREDGKVARVFVGTDGIVFARQVGMMPRDGSLPDRVLKRAFKTKVTVTRGLTH